jgi:hypothetical protein
MDASLKRMQGMTKWRQLHSALVHGELQVQRAQVGRERESDGWARVTGPRISSITAHSNSDNKVDKCLVMSDHVRVVDLATRP